MERLARRYLNEHSRFLDIEGIRFHYRDEGDGLILLLLHGVCASLHTWDPWVERLKDRYRILRADMPGFGFSGPHSRETYRPAEGVRLIEALIRRLGLESFYMAGNSVGGFVSWRYAVAHPERVKKLILIDPVGYNQDLPTVVSLASHPMVRPFARRIMPLYFFEQAAREVFGDKRRLSPAVRRRYYDLAQWGDNREAYVEFFTVMRELCASPELPEGITQLRMPTMLMWGTADAWVPFAHTKLWQRDVPHAVLRAYPGVGHTPMEEIPDETASDAHAFLSEAC